MLRGVSFFHLWLLFPNVQWNCSSGSRSPNSTQAQHRLLYKWTHKWHHEWSTPVALSSMYNHPLDQLIGNILPVSIGLALTNSHFFTQWLWFTWSAMRSLNDHSGYRLFVFPSPVRHDFHHQKSTECFAVWAWGPLDYLHGTDKVFRAKIAAGQLSH